MEVIEILNNKTQLSVSEKINYSLKDIAKGLKQYLKKYNCKFSITSKYELAIKLVSADFKILKSFEEINPEEISYYERKGYSREAIKERNQLDTDLNVYAIGDLGWNNGVFLTDQAKKLFQEIIDLTNLFNWDNTDISTDYFDTRFYLRLSI